MPRAPPPTDAMRLHPARLLESLRASYWFVPSLMVLVAGALAVLMPWLDSRLSLGPGGTFGWIAQTQTDGARTVLGVIAGSVIGVAGTTFSITMVAVSFASANFGPRLIANFMRDRGNQVTLGTFIATFVYCLLVLRRVHGAAGDDASVSYEAFVPHLSVLVALALALASVGVLIYFIHHVPETIDVDRLVASIGRELRRSVGELFPDPDGARRGLPTGRDGRGGGEGGGRDGTAPPGAPGPPTWDERVAGRTLVRVSSGDAGYVQALELERLAEIAAGHDLLVRVRHRPGDFVIDSDAVLDVWPDAGTGAPPVRELRDCFALGERRTARQNSTFLAEQLVEVIGRALSPGTNDPFTAIACLDWLKGALVEFMEREGEADRLDATLPVRARPIDFEHFVAVVFDSTRQYVCGDRNVALHALQTLVDVAARAPRAEHRAALVRRMDELLAASREAMTGPEGADDVAARHAEGMRLLLDPDAREAARHGQGWLGGRA